MTEQQPILTVEDLHVRFDRSADGSGAVDGIGFSLYRGETLGIVGESGSGKSLTALSIMRLLPTGGAAQGRIVFRSAGDGEAADLLSQPEAAMQRLRGRRIAMIFQEPMTSLNPVMRCGAQIVEAIRRHQNLGAPAARRQALQWLERVQLAEPERIFHAYPHQLSGGQKQRVMIAMALSGNPDVLIADEPTTALDVTVQRAILDLIRDLRSQWNGAVLFISHDLGVIAEIADRVLVMRAGKIVEEGPVSDIFRQPRHPYTKGLLACRPPLTERLRRLPVVEDFLQQEEKGFSAEVVTPEASARRLQELHQQTPLLSVQSLVTWFPVGHTIWGRPRQYVRAVDGVSFDVFPGETLGVVGESGCGKTTLGRSILHLVQPTGGQVLYGRHALTDLSEKGWQPLRRELQIIFQDPYASLHPRRRVGEAIVEAMRVHGLHEDDRLRREKAIELLETVQLEADHFYRYPHEFSGGQRQRISIARALAVEPRFLICDESVSALDVSVQAQVLNLLVDLRERYQLTLLFISHDLSVVKFISDRILVMHEGKIAELGPAEEIYRNPQSPYTRRLIEAIPKGR